MTWGWVYKDNEFSFLGELSILVSEYSKVGVFDVAMFKYIEMQFWTSLYAYSSSLCCW